MPIRIKKRKSNKLGNVLSSLSDSLGTWMWLSYMMKQAQSPEEKAQYARAMEKEKAGIETSQKELDYYREKGFPGGQAGEEMRGGVGARAFKAGMDVPMQGPVGGGEGPGWPRAPGLTEEHIAGRERRLAASEQFGKEFTEIPFNIKAGTTEALEFVESKKDREDRREMLMQQQKDVNAAAAGVKKEKDLLLMKKGYCTEWALTDNQCRSFLIGKDFTKEMSNTDLTKMVANMRKYADEKTAFMDDVLFEYERKMVWEEGKVKAATQKNYDKAKASKLKMEVDALKNLPEWNWAQEEMERRGIKPDKREGEFDTYGNEELERRRKMLLEQEAREKAGGGTTPPSTATTTTPPTAPMGNRSLQPMPEFET